MNKSKLNLSSTKAATLLMVIVAIIQMGCANASSNRMTASDVNFNVSHSGSVSVDVGASGSFLSTGVKSFFAGTRISDAAFKAALEESVRISGLFKVGISGTDSDYQLNAKIVSQKDNSTLGFASDMRSTLTVEYVLTRRSDSKLLMRKTVTSSSTATMGDSLIGMNRYKRAVEGAARNNIRQALRSISQLDLT